MSLPKEQKEKGRMLRTSSLVLLIFSRPWSRDHIPTPPRAMIKLFDATCVPTAPRTFSDNPAPSDAFHTTHAAPPSPTS
jgi:hypothetical protein